MSILDKIVQLDFRKDQYVRETTNKNQVVIHHTVSGDNAKAVTRYWGSDKRRVATCIIISRDGTPYQLFSSRYWGYHLGVKAKTFANYGIPYKKLDKYSIGVELTNWGGLKKIDGKFYNAYGGVVTTDIVEYPDGYRGFKYFQKYTDAQIQTLKELLIYWNGVYDIPLDYKGNDNEYDLSLDALNGASGVYSHTSFRSDKSDFHSQKEMLDMLKNLNCSN